MLFRIGLAICSLITVSAQTKGPVIVLTGPPGSGKTTQSEFLRTKYGILTIAAEDLVKDNAVELQKRRQPGVQYSDLREDPALTRFVRERLSRIDLRNGFALDGYPATNYQAEEFRKLLDELELPQPLILQLDVPDAEVHKRLARSGRSSDTKANVDQRLKDYHREFGMVRSYYPEARILKIDGTGTPEKVSKLVEAALRKEGIAGTSRTVK